jgi:hypothetical protein
VVYNQTIMQRHSYRYVKFYTPKGTGYAVVSMDWQKLSIPANNDHRLTYVAGVAFCSPHDNFFKKKGRMIADGRKQRQVNATTVRGCSESRYVTNADFKAILSDVILSAEVGHTHAPPAWAVEAVLAKRFELGLKQNHDDVDVASLAEERLSRKQLRRLTSAYSSPPEQQILPPPSSNDSIDF